MMVMKWWRSLAEGAASTLPSNDPPAVVPEMKSDVDEEEVKSDVDEKGQPSPP